VVTGQGVHDVVPHVAVLPFDEQVMPPSQL